MGLRCLLGHDFGEPETERERTEEGNEVVVTVREVKTCDRCGERQVVSENKEIKSIAQLKETTGVAGDDAGARGSQTATDPMPGTESATGESTADADAGQPTDPSTTADPAAASDADEDPPVGEIIEDAETDEDVDGGDDGDSDEMPVHPAQRDAGADEDATEPEDDDAVILDEDASDEERGQWNEEASPEEIAGADTPTPDRDGDDEDAVIMGEDDGTNAPAEDSDTDSDPSIPEAEGDEDAVIMDEDTTGESGQTPWPEHDVDDEGHRAGAPEGEAADVDFGGGLAPESGDHADGSRARNGADAAEEGTAQSDARGEPRDATSASADAGTDDSGTRSRRPAGRSIDLEQSQREADLEYHCPECGLSRPVGNSSMRAGDICPNCRKGYIDERERQD